MTPVYLLGGAATPGAAETREFLTRNGVSFQWVDLDRDPLLRLLDRPVPLAGGRLPLVVFGDGSTLEGPERFMRTRYVSATPEGSTPPVSEQDRRAYTETALFKQQLARRVGLPTAPQHDAYDVLSSVPGRLA